MTTTRYPARRLPAMRALQVRQQFTGLLGVVGPARRLPAMRALQGALSDWINAARAGRHGDCPP